MYRVQDGWLQEARRALSPNREPRPAHCRPELLVIHNISLPPGCYQGSCVEQLFTNCLDWEAHPYFGQIRGLKVSAHLLIRRTGELIQFVSFDERAWHAGQSSYGGRTNCNDFSIGIELEGCDDEPYDSVQYEVLAGVTRALLAAYPGLGAHAIVGHSDIAPGRKTDPGKAFDWARYRQQL
ncbi:MAG: 1,6-anhydro-N-acetylmuramyl-L-alanine amidase AmpD [Gammaproteobacteria bacterium]|nr:1,6-anhydro-N-acetylmuramyl-L-alanine amidase AmpD [Gammaproteobacteria bacterium]